MSPCLLSSKEVCAESVEYESSKRNIPVYKSSSLTLNYILFNIQLAFMLCYQAVFLGTEVWFLIFGCDISFDDNLLVELWFFVPREFSDMAGLACAHRPVFYICTSTSLSAAPLL